MLREHHGPVLALDFIDFNCPFLLSLPLRKSHVPVAFTLIETCDLKMSPGPSQVAINPDIQLLLSDEKLGSAVLGQNQRKTPALE
jgi:hypothetical protein